jgi:hypothetical protein
MTSDITAPQLIRLLIEREAKKALTSEIGDLVEPEERRDDEEEQLVPHLSPPPRETEREISEPY